MSDQLDLLDYPNWPGFRARDTSKAAADAIAPRVATLRDRVHSLIQRHRFGMTADEAAAYIGESILAVRPRVTELARLGQIKDIRRRNASGRNAIVWMTTDAREAAR